MTRSRLTPTFSSSANVAGTPLEGLSPLQRRYAEVRTQLPTLAQREAAVAAGCRSTSPRGLNVTASRLEKRTREARKWLAQERYCDPQKANLALGVIEHLAQHASTDATKLAAAKTLVEISGFAAAKVSEVRHSFQVQQTTASSGELIGRLAELFGKMPVELVRRILAQHPTVAALLAKPATAGVIDLTPTEIKSGETWEGDLDSALNGGCDGE